MNFLILYVILKKAVSIGYLILFLGAFAAIRSTRMQQTGEAIFCAGVRHKKIPLLLGLKYCMELFCLPKIL